LNSATTRSQERFVYGYNQDQLKYVAYFEDASNFKVTTASSWPDEVMQSDWATLSRWYSDAVVQLYHYEDTKHPHALTGITDENGVRYATWTYDSDGRAISSQHAGGVDIGQVEYNADGTVTTTNSLGLKATYYFVDIQGVKKQIKVEGAATANCSATRSEYTYNGQGLKETITDPKGYVTRFDYNSRGLVTTKTEAEGTSVERITHFKWHDVFPLPVSITETDRVTLHEYNDDGQLLSTRFTAQQTHNDN
jgi:YD repeat-containing protein